MKCEHEGCEITDTTECQSQDYEDGAIIISHYCTEHAYEHGFCYCCGEFWGGIEGFDFNNPTHLCEHCYDALRDEIEDDYDDEEDYYPFDLDDAPTLPYYDENFDYENIPE